MRIITSALILFLFLNTYAQEQLGLRLENYAGINSVTLNPTGNLSNPLRWDIHLGGGDFFVENNYFFVQSTNTFDLLKNAASTDFYSVPYLEGPAPADAYILDFISDGKRRFGYVNANITGPSIAYKISENHSVGIFTKARFSIGTQAVQTEFSFYDFDSKPFFEPFPTEPSKIDFLLWSEVGLNYAFQIPTERGFLGMGINAKFLSGYEAAWFQFDNLETYEKNSRNSARLGRLDVRHGYTNSNLIRSFDDFDLQRNGTGIAFDLGLVNIIQGTDKAYDFKLGISILDLGFINLNRNIASYRIQTDSVRIIGGNEYDEFTQLDDLDAASELFSQQALGSPTAASAGNSVRFWLPTALSIQADYAFTENIFFNATLVQRIPLASVGLERGNLFALTPRFEHRWFSASLPLIIHNWKDFRIGLAARLAFLTIGSDNLGSLLGESDYTGTDFYFAFKVNFSGSENGINFGYFNRRNSFRGKVKCYDF